MKKKLPGINIQWPWSELLLSGKKTIETRSYRLPKRLENVELAVIETPGPRGKKQAGIQNARVIGTITFTSSKLYNSRKAWLSDTGKHLVKPGDVLFDFSSDRAKWGWVVGKYTKLKKPISAPKVKGIIYAKPFELDV